MIDVRSHSRRYAVLWLFSVPMFWVAGSACADAPVTVQPPAAQTVPGAYPPLDYDPEAAARAIRAPAPEIGGATFPDDSPQSSDSKPMPVPATTPYTGSWTAPATPPNPYLNSMPPSGYMTNPSWNWGPGAPAMGSSSWPYPSWTNDPRSPTYPTTAVPKSAPGSTGIANGSTTPTEDRNAPSP